MIKKGSKNGTVRFAIHPCDGANRVQLVGDFTQWNPVTMRRQKNGDYVCIMPLADGTYEYKFIVDGEWEVDPDNNSWSANAFGTMNSIAMVG